MNVSGTVDADPDWGQGHDEIIRDRDAWVGVSAQGIGIMKLWESQRYGSLSVTGNRTSFDIFSQAGAVLRQDAPTLLGTHRPVTLVGAGESR
jgi:hypothetical protein